MTRRVRLQILSLIFASVGIGLGQACSTAFEAESLASLSKSANLPSSIAQNLELTCKPDMDPAATPLRRLNRYQYVNAMVEVAPSLLGWSGGYGIGSTRGLTGALGPVMGILPGDVREKNSFSALDQTISEFHVFSYFFIASSTADMAVANTSWLNAFGGSCLKAVATDGAVTDACVDAFINKLGRTALRKKMTPEDVTFFKTFYKEFATPKEGVAAIIQTMLLHPRFLFIVETDGKPVNGRPDLLELNDFEIAQRLSFFFLGKAPTMAMLNDAEAGLFTASEASLKTQIEKYFTIGGKPDSYSYSNHPTLIQPIQSNYNAFWDELFEVSKMPALPEGPVGNIFSSIYGDGGRYSWAHNVDTDPYLIAETMNFANRITWFENKKFSDLMSDNSVVLSGGTAKFYGVPQVDGVSTLPNHAGILTRAAFLVTGDEDTHPFTRGAFIRRNILCDQLPSPNPDALPDRALDSPEGHPAWNNRDRYTNKTASASCMGCHAQINPLAFALEDFDSIARNRNGNFEGVFKVVNNNGNVTASIVGKPMTDAVVKSLEFSRTEVIPQVNGGIELSRELGLSSKANMCFARQVFRHTFGRKETSNDACILQDMFANGTAADGSIKRMISSIPMSKHFRIKKVGP